MAFAKCRPIVSEVRIAVAAVVERNIILFTELHGTCAFIISMHKTVHDALQWNIVARTRIRT